MKKLCMIIIAGLIALMLCSCEYGPAKNELIEAIWNGGYDDVVKAVENGSDVNSVKPYNAKTSFANVDYNPASIALSENKIDIFKYLVSNGSDINYTYKGNWSYLMREASRFEFDMVEFLLDNGADINFESKEWGTALDYLIFIEHFDENRVSAFEMIEFLINHGAIVSDKTLEIAAARKDEELLELL